MGLLNRSLGLALGAVLFVAGTAQAQHTEVDLGGMIGASLPTNDIANLYVGGYVFGGTFRVVPANWPVGLQVDVLYSHYNRNAADIADHGLENLSGSLGVVWPIDFEQTSLEPYLLGGASINAMKVIEPRTTPNYGSNTNLGLYIGGGLAFKSQTARIAPLIDFRVNGIFGSDPREGAYFNFSLGLLILLRGAHSHR